MYIKHNTTRRLIPSSNILTYLPYSDYVTMRVIMLLWLRELIGNWLFAKELKELNRWKTVSQQYHQWLVEFPEVKLVLENLITEVENKKWLDCYHPPSNEGPWEISGLRERLRSSFSKNIDVDVYKQNMFVDNLINHYCKLIDNLGDLPIPNFEVWADTQYKLGVTYLTVGNYFREPLYNKEKKNETC